MTEGSGRFVEIVLVSQVGGGKAEKVKNVGDSTMSKTVEFNEDKEEEEGSVLGGGVDEVSIIPVVYFRGAVSVSLLGYSSYVGSSSESSRPSLPLSLGARHIKDYFKKKRGMKRKKFKPQQEKSRREDWSKQMRVAVCDRMVVGFGGLVHMESGCDNSAEE